VWSAPFQPGQGTPTRAAILIKRCPRTIIVNLLWICCVDTADGSLRLTARTPFSGSGIGWRRMEVERRDRLRFSSGGPPTGFNVRRQVVAKTLCMSFGDSNWARNCERAQSARLRNLSSSIAKRLDNDSKDSCQLAFARDISGAGVGNRPGRSETMARPSIFIRQYPACGKAYSTLHLFSEK